MKIKQILAFSLVALSSAFFLNSCGDGDEVNPAPGIDFIAEGNSIVSNVTMPGDSTFTMIFNVSDNSKVKTVEVKSVVNGRITPQLDTTINAATAKITLVRKTYAAEATETWTITATDDKDQVSTKSITITTTSGATGDLLKDWPLDNSSQPWKVWNFKGTGAGAFDLLDGAPQHSGDPNVDKDVQDSVKDSEIANWPGRWTTRNGTMFKKITGYAYADLKNTGQLDAAWNASGNSFSSMIVTKGDIYIAKIRGTNTKILIEITDVVKTPTLNDNKDYVQFKFKKKDI